ncbi:hypothetical protein BGZ98_009729 [Dissophora globulifera]|nr:hypothetical protein BGZ98_009729 [Dissophora globulifera]
MFTPRKNRHIRKKVDIEDEESAVVDSADDSHHDTPATDTTGTEEITYAHGLQKRTTRTLGTLASNATIIAAVATPDKVKKVKKKTATKVLSFGDEEQNADDIFKVKKSSASRRLALNRTEDLERDQATITSRATVGNTVSYSKEALDELRKSTLSTTPSSRSYGDSGDFVDEKFPTAHEESGQIIIPDANAIHLARKKREQMRLRNDKEEEEFISLAGGDDNTMAEESNKRLVREEDDDMDDGEADLERVMGDKLALGSRAQRRAEKSKRNARKELFEELDDEDEDEEETREWEMQQIRNAGVVAKGPKKDKPAPVQKSVAFPTTIQVPTLSAAKNRLQGHLENLRSQHSQHIRQLEQIRREEAGIMLRTADAEDAISKMSARYTFFQELRSYCRNLAAFFEEKFPELESIERDYKSMLSDRTKVVVERRRLDMLDDLSEFANVIDDDGASKSNAPVGVDEFGRSIGVDPHAARKRRRSDKERRHKQRKQSLEEGAADADVYDGLSTDDELGEGDERELGEAIMELEERRINIFKEVDPEFRSINAVKRHFQAWKTDYPRDYNKAYGGLLLPMVFDFYVRQETCLWNPIRVRQDISEQTWHRAVSSYTIVHASTSKIHSDSDSDRGEDEEEDMDKELMTNVVAKSLCPKITQFLIAGGVDLYSAKQTRCFKAILDQLLDYVDKKNNKMDQLIKATLQAIIQTVQAHRDQFIEAAQPLTPRHILTTHGLEARERFLWRSIGLFRNLMLLRRFVPVGSIDAQVVDGLLHDCILRLLDGDDSKDSIAKYRMFTQGAKVGPNLVDLPYTLRREGLTLAKSSCALRSPENPTFSFPILEPKGMAANAKMGFAWLFDTYMTHFRGMPVYVVYWSIILKNSQERDLHEDETLDTPNPRSETPRREFQL